jgi:molecular chaperone GrpE
MEREAGQEPPAEENGTDPAPELSPAPEPTDVKRLQAVLEEAERERGQFKSLFQRAQADLTNFRRRTEEEQAEIQRNASAQLILKLLPGLDDLERALHAGPQGPPSQGDNPSAEPGWLEGMRLIARKFQAVLEEAGVLRIEVPLDRPFDPWEHEVVFYQETPDHPDGQVLSVVREGYKLHGKVLRPAQVAVAKAPPQEAKPEGAEGSESTETEEEPGADEK